jgi:hypothetical protein
MQDGKGARRRTSPQTQRRAIAERRCFFLSFKSRIQVYQSVGAPKRQLFVQVNVEASRCQNAMTCMRHGQHTEQTVAVGGLTASASCILHTYLCQRWWGICKMPPQGVWLADCGVCQPRDLGCQTRSIYQGSRIHKRMGNLGDGFLTLPGFGRGHAMTGNLAIS